MSDESMPEEIVNYMRVRNWGSHHVHWHLVRIWDIVSDNTRQWALSQGWQRYHTQEGEEGNGLEFLAMHRVMIQILTQEFPQHVNLFEGWTSPPTDPNDSLDPLPNGAQTNFNPDMLKSVDRLTSNIDTFDGEDTLGAFIETSLRPFPNSPRRRSSDMASGIHNYIHNRFQDRNSSINIGDPEVNIENKRFWKLHSWIDKCWERYRQISGRSNNDPKYLSLLAEAQSHMGLPVISGVVPLVEIHKSSDAHSHHHSFHIPPEVKEDIINSFYFCDID